MDAIKFLKEKHRLCMKNACETCPFSVCGYEMKYPEEAVSIVEKWSKENPVQTNADKFEEVFGQYISCDGTLNLPAGWGGKPYKAPKEGNE